MALPTKETDNWTQGLDFPSQLFGGGGFGSNDYELYEEEGEFVLTVEMPGFEREEIDVAWQDGVLNVAAEHTDEERGRKRTYHRRFRFPRVVDEEDIRATYRNGVLEVTLPAIEEGTTRGKHIPVEG